MGESGTSTSILSREELMRRDSCCISESSERSGAAANRGHGFVRNEYYREQPCGCLVKVRLGTQSLRPGTRNFVGPALHLRLAWARRLLQIRNQNLRTDAGWVLVATSVSAPAEASQAVEDADVVSSAVKREGVDVTAEEMQACRAVEFSSRPSSECDRQHRAATPEVDVFIAADVGLEAPRRIAKLLATEPPS